MLGGSTSYTRISRYKLQPSRKLEIIDTDVNDFEQEYFVNLMMYNPFRKERFCVYETIKTFVVPPENWTWDDRVFTLKNSYTEDGKIFLIYYPAQTTMQQTFSNCK